MAYDSEYYAANKEKYKGYNTRYREQNKDKEKARHKIYKEQNKEKHAEYERKRRALKRNSNHEFYSTENVIEKWGSDCYLCNLPINLQAERRTGRKGWETGLQIDHVVPIYKGGEDRIENVRPAHGICNSKKNKYDTIVMIGA
jgi:5-methylcytosine-specific restriction endonuclease McrA